MNGDLHRHAIPAGIQVDCGQEQRQPAAGVEVEREGEDGKHERVAGLAHFSFFVVKPPVGEFPAAHAAAGHEPVRRMQGDKHDGGGQLAGEGNEGHAHSGDDSNDDTCRTVSKFNVDNLCDMLVVESEPKR